VQQNTRPLLGNKMCKKRSGLCCIIKCAIKDAASVGK
jgi:hypothetical protein